MALSEIDRNLLDRCLSRKPRAWEDFVDRFLGLVVHVINHTAQCRSIRISREDCDDLAAEVFLAVVRDDFAALRTFRGDSSLATYLTVIARRVVTAQLLKNKGAASSLAAAQEATARADEPQRISDREEVERLLDELEGAEADIVRRFHLEGQTYREISAGTGVPENSIGPTLSRARDKMRRAAAE